MKTFQCTCNNTLFFENDHCLQCGSDVGWCPRCERVTTLVPSTPDMFQCGNPQCGATLAKCHNFHAENVCNRCVLADPGTPPDTLCDCCTHNETIPDLSVDGNREKWAQLEAAKRRLVYTLDLLGLPRPSSPEESHLPLSFDFKADIVPPKRTWGLAGKSERVFTGHANGKITINIREADPVERETLRVDLGEAHRTLVGHFRHEIAHYYWDLLVRDQQPEPACVAVFGDHTNPTYADALERYYQQGAPAGWAENYVSAYATMHPWEDFAETFATWLDLVSVIDTAHHVGFSDVPDLHTADTPTLVAAYRRIGIAMNEMNRTMGLNDFLPEVMTPAVVKKLDFINQLVRDTAQAGDRPTPTARSAASRSASIR